MCRTGGRRYRDEDDRGYVSSKADATAQEKEQVGFNAEGVTEGAVWKYDSWPLAF